MTILLDDARVDKGKRADNAKVVDRGRGPSIVLDEGRSPAVIKVVGVGGAGCNSINRMIEAGLSGVEFIAVNTDAQALELCKAPIKLQLGAQVTRGLGAGADPEVGRRAATEDTERLLSLVDGADMVFITCGMGGGTGTGASPVIAQLASESGALTVAVVSKPFEFEGSRRRKIAEEGIASLAKHVDTLITIPNERLVKYVERTTTFVEALKIADDVLRQAVQGIADIITKPGLINRDFADVRTVMKGMGHAVMGVGLASGEHRAVEAAQQAIASPLLENTSVSGARGILINITGGMDITLNEVNEAAEIITEGAAPEATILFGAVIDQAMEGSLQVTVIATGFGEQSQDHQAEELKEEEKKRGPTVSPFLPSGSDYGVHVAEEDEIPPYLRNQLD